MKECNDKLHQIESIYSVNEIEYKGIKLWANIRIYLFDKLLSMNNGIVRRGSLSSSSILIILKGLFFYNFLRIFNRWDIWLFVAADRRKVFNGTAVHRVSGVIPEICKNTLIIEKPFPKFHYSKKQVGEKNIISESFLFVLTYFYEIYYKIVRPEIKNEELLIQIIKDYEINFNYRDVVYRFLAQYSVMNMLLRITMKPKAVFIEAPYNSMGYIFAFRCHGVKVIEMQHGVINENHFAYNSIIPNNQYSPDILLVYGDIERKCFENKNKCYVPDGNVNVVGSYILEKVNEQEYLGLFDSERKKYRIVIAIAAQELVENQLINFINDVAVLDNTIFYAYIPRKEKNYCGKFNCDNIKIVNGNIYEIIKESDLHSTVFSTTCIEAQYLKKINVFINIDNQSINYYGDVLNSNSGAYYANTAEEYLYLVEKHINDKVKFNSVFFANNHRYRMKKIINDYIC